MGDSVFISYSHLDSARVQTLVSAIADVGVSVWLDVDRLAPGTRWRTEIRAGIRAGGAMVVCFSSQLQNASRSYVHEELTLAIDELRVRPWDRSWLYPVRLDNCEIPDRPLGGGETLRDLQHFDLFPDLNAKSGEFAQVLSRRLLT